jgi:hypothetical protein
MRVLVVPSGRAAAKVAAAITELNLQSEELVFADCPTAAEKYPDFNIVEGVEINGTQNPTLWKLNVQTAVENVDAVLFFMSTSGQNYGTLRTFKVFAKDKLFWVFDNGLADELYPIMELRPKVVSKVGSFERAAKSFFASHKKASKETLEQLQLIDLLMDRALEALASNKNASIAPVKLPRPKRSELLG